MFKPKNDTPFQKIKSILSGEESIRLHLEFLYRNNHTDLLILKNTKVKKKKLILFLLKKIKTSKRVPPFLL